MSENHDIFEALKDDIDSDKTIPEEAKRKIFQNIFKMKSQKLNIMITGATGCGKSSTINALFNTEVAKVGIGVDPETMVIEKYDLNNLILWDSPGLGDGKEKDNKHANAIISKLNEVDGTKNPLIDLVLVILDGSSKDLGTSYELINSIIIPNLGNNANDRILVAINQADIAMKTPNAWNVAENKPSEKLEQFLEQKVKSVKTRIKEATGVHVEPIFYAAGYKAEGESQRPYNLSKLFYFILKNTPESKRIIYATGHISKDAKTWQDNDDSKNYNEAIKETLWESITSCVSAGADIGGDIGGIFGKGGAIIGRGIGTVAGAAVGFVKNLFRWW